MSNSTLDHGLPSGRDLIPCNLLSACERFCDSRQVTNQPESIFSGFQQVLLEPAGASRYHNKLQNVFKPACKALQQSLASGWPTTRLLRDFIAFLVDASSASESECCDDAGDFSMTGFACTNDLLVCLWMLCQLLGALDQVDQLGPYEWS